MKIYEANITNHVYGRGGPAATVGLSSAGAAVGSAAAAGGSAANAASALVGTAVGGAVGMGFVATSVGGPTAPAIAVATVIGAIVSNGVTDSMNNYNQNNPAPPSLQPVSMFGPEDMFSEIGLARAEVDAMDNQTGSTSGGGFGGGVASQGESGNNSQGGTNDGMGPGGVGGW
jgi:hypothetical protein